MWVAPEQRRSAPLLETEALRFGFPSCMALVQPEKFK
jgi:hypothetical protein